MKKQIKADYDTILTHVINGCKCRVPIYKTLTKYKWNRTDFYKLSTPETIRYINELKGLTKSKRGESAKTRKRIDIADFSIIEL